MFIHPSILPIFIFWISVFFIFYTYVGYAALLGVWSFFRKQTVKKESRIYSISVVIAALNEEAHIGERIKNLLASDYPKDKMEIIVISDGSTDRTETIVGSFGPPVKILSLPQRSGKATAIQLGVTQSKSEVIVFTDARQTFKPDTIKQLVANFNDPRVGAVSGRLFLRSETQESNINQSLDLYWSLEEWIRQKESTIDSSVGVTGAIYAIRKNLYPGLPPETILDDVYIPMRIALNGYRILLDDTAQAYDILTSSKKELKRKIRTLAGNYQLMTLIPEILSPSKNRLWFQFLSHKAARLWVPYFFITALLSNTLMLGGFYRFSFALQLLFYGCILAAPFLKNRPKLFKYFSIPYALALLNYAAIMALFQHLKKSKNIWS